MDMHKYDTRVRQAISEELVACSKRKQEYVTEYILVITRIANEQDTLSYSEYNRLLDKRDFLLKMQEVEQIQLDVWDKAREICLNIADEF